jgi:hypothetical protein
MKCGAFKLTQTRPEACLKSHFIMIQIQKGACFTTLDRGHSVKSKVTVLKNILRSFRKKYPDHQEFILRFLSILSIFPSYSYRSDLEQQAWNCCLEGRFTLDVVLDIDSIISAGQPTAEV